MLKRPYLLFLGDAPDMLSAKVAVGLRDWRREYCVGQLSFPGCEVDIGLPEMTISEAAAAGVKTLVVGVANRGGVISDAWIETLVSGVENGMDVAAGLHQRLKGISALVDAAKKNHRELFDVRHSERHFGVASGTKRPGKRLLTVGTDCSCGKMYTTLAFEKEMRARGMSADFRATGQTGILIAGSGIAVDAVVADFISGAVEALAPANEEDHWDLIEGQGSLFHPSFAGVSLGLLHGAQPDALVLCHEPVRTHMRGLPHYPVPDIATCMQANLDAAVLTNPSARFVGACINTAALPSETAIRYLADLSQRIGLPAVDPVRNGVGPIVDMLA